MSLAELTQLTGLDATQLRIDLYRLTEEGRVERRQRGNLPVWTVKLSTSSEQGEEKPFRKYL